VYTEDLKSVLLYSGIIFGSLLLGAVGAEIFLSYRSAPRLPLPFYNVLYPYVMFRPNESYTYETKETFEMSHNKSRIFVYTNEDGFRIPSPGYKLPKEKPAGQLRIAVLGGSLVELASTFDVTLPGSLKTLLQHRYPGRDIEVINAGIQSCVSRQSIVQLLVTVVDYHPDIVILYDGGNDIGLPLTYESRPNYPYNFQTMEEAWNLYREEHRASLWRIALERSYLFRMARARFNPSKTELVPTADEPLAGTNRVSAERVIADRVFVVNQITAYLSNWRKLVELSQAYHFRAVSILTPASAGLDPNYAVPRMMQSFHLNRETALQWIQAFDLLYSEAGRQIEQLRVEYPGATFLNLTHFLQPSEKYFWDLAHLYDEANVVVAERIYSDIRPAIEASLASRVTTQ
jgi:lysophospholipase L1-like esterase